MPQEPQLDPAFDPSQDQQVVDQLGQPFRLCHDVGADFVPGCGVELVANPLHERGTAIDRGHRRPQLVGKEAQERLAQELSSARLGDVT